MRRTLYRGLPNLCIPEDLLNFGAGSTSGFIERAFVSCSTRQDVALQYAGLCGCSLRKDEEDVVYCSTHKSTLLEISTGALDCGAWLGWVSQYPQEDEFCLPAGSFFEVTGVRRERHANVIEVSARESKSGVTLDVLRQHRKKCVLNFGNSLVSEAQQLLTCTPALVTHVQSELGRLENLKESFTHTFMAHSAEWFNSVANYQKAINHTFCEWKSILESACLVILAWQREQQEFEATWTPHMKRHVLKMNQMALLIMQRCTDGEWGAKNVRVLQKRVADLVLKYSSDLLLSSHEAAQHWCEYGKALQQELKYHDALSAFEHELALLDERKQEPIDSAQRELDSINQNSEVVSRERVSIAKSPENCVLVCMSLCRIGNLYRLMGDEGLACKMLEDARDKARALDRKYHPVMADVAQAFGLLYYSQAKTREALLQFEESLRIKMVHLSVQHESVQEDLEHIRRVIAAAKFEKGIHKFRALERFFWIVTNSSNPHRASSHNDLSLKEVVNYMHAAKRMTTTSAEWGLRVLAAALECVAEAPDIMGKVALQVVSEAVCSCMLSFCGDERVQATGLSALLALCKGYPEIFLGNSSTALDLQAVWRAMAPHIASRGIQEAGLCILRGLADREMEKAEDKMRAQRQIDTFMADKALVFEGDSWDLEVHATNKSILAGIVDILKEHPELALNVDATQEGTSTSIVHQDPRSGKTFEQCFPGVSKAVNNSFMACARAMMTIDTLRAMGCGNRMSSSAQVGTMEKIVFQVKTEEEDASEAIKFDKTADIERVAAPTKTLVSHRSVLSVVMAAMRRHKGDAIIQDHACAVLLGVTSNSSVKARAIIALEAKEIISEIMDGHASAQHIVQTGSSCLGLLADQQTHSDAFSCRFWVDDQAENRMRLDLEACQTKINYLLEQHERVIAAVVASEADADDIVSAMMPHLDTVEDVLNASLPLLAGLGDKAHRATEQTRLLQGQLADSSQLASKELHANKLALETLQKEHDLLAEGTAQLTNQLTVLRDEHAALGMAQQETSHKYTTLLEEIQTQKTENQSVEEKLSTLQASLTERTNELQAQTSHAAQVTAERDQFEGKVTELTRLIEQLRAGEGRWRLIFRQTYKKDGAVRSKDEWLLVNENDPTSEDYSILRSADALDSFRDKSGAFEFQMRWPQGGPKSLNHWRQHSNPLLRASKGWGVDGLEEITIAHSDHDWGGLELTEKPCACLMNGSTRQKGDEWFYPIGYSMNATDSMPTWSLDPAISVTELWVKEPPPSDQLEVLRKQLEAERGGGVHGRTGQGVHVHVERPGSEHRRQRAHGKQKSAQEKLDEFIRPDPILPPKQIAFCSNSWNIAVRPESLVVESAQQKLDEIRKAAVADESVDEDEQKLMVDAQRELDAIKQNALPENGPIIEGITEVLKEVCRSGVSVADADVHILIMSML